MYLPNKYTTTYYKIINRAKSRTLTEYIEKHHIIPRSLGGNDSLDNLVELTAREHFICHLLLTKMLTGKDKAKMSQAVWMMVSCSSDNQSRYKVNNRVYEKLKVNMSMVKKDISTWNKGVSPNDATRLKLRSASISNLVKSGKITQEEAEFRNAQPLPEIKKYNKRKNKVVKTPKGRSKGGWKWSDEDKEKLSLQRLGRTPWNKGRKNTTI